MFILENIFGERQYEIKPGSFPDGSLHLTLPDDPTICLIIWYYENDAELFTLQCIRDHYSWPLMLEMPYIPHARMDRVKSAEEVFTLKTFCKLINAMNFNEVIVRDPHSNVSAALLDRVVLDPVKPYIQHAINMIQSDNLVAFFPDEGAMKRYSSLLDIPYAFGVKNRDWQTGKILGLTLMNGEVVKDKDVLIIDDICSYGGTFYHSALALKEAGARNIYLYVTHCENNIFNGDMYHMEEMCRIYTPDPRVNHELDSLSKLYEV
jgi:ribose-phosphate pyrophosphokinase